MGLGTSPTIWLGDTGYRYTIRQIGEHVWWYAENRDKSRSQVFSGMLSSPRVFGEWAEMTSSGISTALLPGLSNGKLALRVGDTEIVVESQTGRFTETTLKLVGPFPQ